MEGSTYIQMDIMPFPNIDPVAFSVGPFDVRWYGLAYLVGIVLGIRLGDRLAQHYREFGVQRGAFSDFTTWAALGVIFGGRLGSILLYQPDYYLANPLKILAFHEGGMAFHGGLLGVVIAALLFCRRREINFLAFADIMACVGPIGLLLGRIANFINGELWGRPSDALWAVVFPSPHAGGIPRHPSELYEAALEGAALFAILNLLVRLPNVRTHHGALAGMFLVGYATFRSLVEFTREPDAPLIGPLTRGQAYSLPMLVAGATILILTLRRPQRKA